MPLEVTNHSSFLDSSLSTFFLTSFNDECKVRLSGGGPRNSFAAFVEWVLVSNNSPFTISPAEDHLTSLTPDPEPSLPSPRCVEQESEPTTTDETLDEPYGAKVLRIAPELEPNMSDQVQEPATVLATGENAMDSESVEESNAPLHHV